MNFNNDIFECLNQIAANNNREWYTANKPKVDAVRFEFEKLFDALITGIYKFDPSIGMQEAKKCMYRMYRDTRFSNDKTPYKTHIAGFVSSGGFKQHSMPGYYLHIEPGACCFGAGVYMPMPEELNKIRNEIYYNVAEFKKILDNAEFKKYYNGLWSESVLKRAPKNFPADFPDIDLLKNKSFSVIHYFKNEEAMQKDFFNYVLQGFKASYELNAFLLRAMQ